MTTDTAVRVTRTVVQDKGIYNPFYASPDFASGAKLRSHDTTVPLDEIPYTDSPELRLNEHETTEMPFRYVKNNKGEPIMPKVGLCSYSDWEGRGLLTKSNETIGNV